MTAFALTVEWQVGGQDDAGLRRLAVAFERAGDEVRHLGRHVWPLVAKALEKQGRAQFSGEGVGPSGPWVELSPRYRAWKERVAPGKPILELSGALRRGLTSSSAPTALREWSDDEMTFGTRGVEYASAHQTGAGALPARPPLDFTDELRGQLLSAARRGMLAAVREAAPELLPYEGETYTDEGGETFAVSRGARGGAYYEAGGARVYLSRTAAGGVARRIYRRRR